MAVARSLLTREVCEDVSFFFRSQSWQELAATLDVGELGLFLLSERARTKSLGAAGYLGNLLGSEASALGRGRGAHHDVVVSISVEHGSSIAEIERNARIIFVFFRRCEGSHPPC